MLSTTPPTKLNKSIYEEPKKRENNKPPPPNMRVNSTRQEHPFISPFLSVLTLSPIYHSVNTVTHAMQITEKPLKQTLKILWRDGGVPRFFRGYAPGVINSATGKSIAFGIKGTLLDSLPKERQTFLYRIGITSVSILAKILICLPLENIKISLQISNLGSETERYKSAVDTARTILNERGIIGLYRTLPLAAIKSYSAQAPYLMIYYKLKNDLPIESAFLRNAVTGILSSCGTLITVLPVDHIRIHILGRKEFKNEKSLKAVQKFFQQSIKSKGKIRTLLSLYHSSPPAIMQIMIGGTGMAISIHLYNEILENFTGTLLK